MLMAIKFYSALDLPPVKKIDCDQKIIDRYSWVFDKEKQKYLYVKVGTMDWYAFIQASKDSTDIHQIIKRVENGDVSLLNVGTSSFSDVSVLPNDLRGLAELSDKLRSKYDNFDNKFKSLFKDYNDYVDCVLSNSVQQRVDTYNNKIKESLVNNGGDN